MSIISVKERSTNDINQYEKFKRSDASLILANSTSTEEFSVELTIGNCWAEVIDKDNPEMFSFNGDNAILKPNSSIVVEVSEKIHVPFNVYGMIVPTGTAFLEKGIIIGAGKVEPSYNGKLKILLYNTSKVKRELKSGEKLASAIFFRTDRTITSPLFFNEDSVNTRNKTILNKITSFIKQDPKFIVSQFLMLISSSLVAALFTWFMLTQHDVGTDNIQKEAIDTTHKLGIKE